MREPYFTHGSIELWVGENANILGKEFCWLPQKIVGYEGAGTKRVVLRERWQLKAIIQQLPRTYYSEGQRKKRYVCLFPPLARKDAWAIALYGGNWNRYDCRWAGGSYTKEQIFDTLESWIEMIKNNDSGIFRVGADKKDST